MTFMIRILFLFNKSQIINVITYSGRFDETACIENALTLSRTTYQIKLFNYNE